jgi:hypothetical protein
MIWGSKTVSVDPAPTSVLSDVAASGVLLVLL